MARNLTTGLQRGLRRGLRPGMGGGDIFTTAPLDLWFARYKTLDPRVTFTRASSGTYVDSQGVIRTATTNLALQSEDFSTSWGSNLYTITTNSTTAPNGAVTADKAVRDTSNAITSLSANVTVTASTAYNFSCFVKAAGWSKVGLREGASTGNYVTFDLATASIISSSGATGSVAAYPDGWYRISMQMTTVGAQTTYGMRIVPLPNDYASGTPSYSFAGDGTSGLYVWGAQLEQSSTVGEYIPTTSTINSAPRFDHDPTTGESLGLLVEEQRTNSIRNNTMVGAVAGTPGTLPTNWVLQGGGIGTLTQQIVGTGTQNGINYIDIKYSGTTSTTDTRIAFEPSTQIVAATGQSWTASAYTAIIAGSLSNISAVEHAIVERNAAGGFLGESAQAVNATNSLVRGSVSRTLNDANAARVNSQIKLSFPSGVAIDITLRIGMPQLEQGAFPTSVIPTTTAAVTRSADVASITGANFNSFYNNTTWTLAVTGDTANQTAIMGGIRAASDAFGDGPYIARSLTNYGFFKSDLSTFIPSSPSDFRITAALEANNAGLSLNGSTASIDSTCSVTTNPISLSIGGRTWSGTGSELNGHLKRLTYWPQRLPNSTLQGITQ